MSEAVPNSINPGIIITGDVHHNSIKFRDQLYFSGTEVQAAISYAEIIEEFGLKATLFITGKAIRESIELCKILVKKKYIEFGGHTYNCYEPRLIYKIWKKFSGGGNGPYQLQEWDVKLSTRMFRKLLGLKIHSWRNHSYRHDKNTDEILRKYGILNVSNDVGPNENINIVQTKNGIIVKTGINVWPDHEHLMHGALDRKQQGKRKFGYSKFPDRIFSPAEWVDQACRSVEQHLRMGMFAVLLVHPSCMMATDNMSTLRNLCRRLKGIQSYTISEASSSIRYSEMPIDGEGDI